jgi:Kae1-associated kinase Bud32
MTGPWRGERVIAQGAEAILEEGTFLGRAAVLKLRRPKGYRHPELERALRTSRVRSEARALREARAAGVRTPAVLDMDVEEGRLVLERIEGPTVRAAFDDLGEVDRGRVARAIGTALGALHAAGIVHGDPTTSNFIIEGVEGAGPAALAVLDISLGGRAEGVEERGVDLRLLYEAWGSTHHAHADLFDAILEGYEAACPDVAREAIARMDAIAARGRYVARGARGDDDETAHGEGMKG